MTLVGGDDKLQGTGPGFQNISEFQAFKLLHSPTVIIQNKTKPKYCCSLIVVVLRKVVNERIKRFQTSSTEGFQDDAEQIHLRMGGGWCMHLNSFPHCQHGLRKLTVKERNKRILKLQCFQATARLDPGRISEWNPSAWPGLGSCFSLSMAAPQGCIYSSTLESPGVFPFLFSADGQLQFSV